MLRVKKGASPILNPLGKNRLRSPSIRDPRQWFSGKETIHSNPSHHSGSVAELSLARLACDNVVLSKSLIQKCPALLCSIDGRWTTHNGENRPPLREVANAFLTCILGAFNLLSDFARFACPCAQLKDLRSSCQTSCHIQAPCADFFLSSSFSHFFPSTFSFLILSLQFSHFLQASSCIIPFLQRSFTSKSFSSHFRGILKLPYPFSQQSDHSDEVSPLPFFVRNCQSISISRTVITRYERKGYFRLQSSRSLGESLKNLHAL